MTITDEFTHEVRFIKSYDRREEPEARYGACGMKMMLILRGPKAVITFEVLTAWASRPLKRPFNWNAAKPWARDDKPGVDFGHPSPGPMGGGVSIHCPEKLNDWWLGPTECNVVEGGVCFGDTGFMVGDAVLDALVSEGDAGVWRELREIYDAWIKVVTP